MFISTYTAIGHAAKGKHVVINTDHIQEIYDRNNGAKGCRIIFATHNIEILDDIREMLVKGETK